MFVKGYWFSPFAINMGKNISKSLCSKYSQKLLDHSKQSATDALKTASKKANHKTPTGDLIRNEIADKIKKVTKNISQNNS